NWHSDRLAANLLAGKPGAIRRFTAGLTMSQFTRGIRGTVMPKILAIDDDRAAAPGTAFAEAMDLCVCWALAMLAVRGRPRNGKEGGGAKWKSLLKR
ncbi:MAG: hypothetical protein ABI614_24525, partial [Planctomycetota bacterium]